MGNNISSDSLRIASSVDIEEGKNYLKLLVNVSYFHPTQEVGRNLYKTFVYPVPRGIENFKEWKGEKEKEALAAYLDFLKRKYECSEAGVAEIEVTELIRKWVEPFTYTRFY